MRIVGGCWAIGMWKGEFYWVSWARGMGGWRGVGGWDVEFTLVVVDRGRLRELECNKKL